MTKKHKAKKAASLKPCPFCGSKAKRDKYPSGLNITGCSNQKCAVKPEAWSWSRKYDSAKIWNKRSRKRK